MPYNYAFSLKDYQNILTMTYKTSKDYEKVNLTLAVEHKAGITGQLVQNL